MHIMFLFYQQTGEGLYFRNTSESRLIVDLFLLLDNH